MKTHEETLRKLVEAITEATPVLAQIKTAATASLTPIHPNIVLACIESGPIAVASELLRKLDRVGLSIPPEDVYWEGRTEDGSDWGVLVIRLGRYCQENRELSLRVTPASFWNAHHQSWELTIDNGDTYKTHLCPKMDAGLISTLSKPHE